MCKETAQAARLGQAAIRAGARRRAVGEDETSRPFSGMLRWSRKHKMATHPDPLSPAAFGIDTVGVLTRHVAPGSSSIREVMVSLARVRFGEVATKSDPTPAQPALRPRLKPGASPRRY